MESSEGDRDSNQHSTAESPYSARTFEPFPKLPIEVRLEIWRDVLPHRRIIKLHGSSIQLESDREDNDEAFHGYVFNATRDNISLVATCRESRSVVKETHCLCLGNLCRQPIYLNPKADIVLFETNWLRPFERRRFMYSNIRDDNLRYIAIHFPTKPVTNVCPDIGRQMGALAEVVSYLSECQTTIQTFLIVVDGDDLPKVLADRVGDSLGTMFLNVLRTVQHNARISSGLVVGGNLTNIELVIVPDGSSVNDALVTMLEEKLREA